MSFRSLLLLLLLPCATIDAQEDVQVHDAPYLITGLQRWVGEGEDPQPGHLLVRDAYHWEFLHGDPEATAFPEAQRFAAEEDWLLLPGLMHADLPFGRGELPQNPYRGSASNPTEGPIPSMEYGEHQSFFAWWHAADGANWRPEAADSWREQGFTHGQLLPQRGLVQGHAALLSLNGRPLAEALLEREGAQLLSLRSISGYPQTPVAALAMHRQLLLDQDLPGLSPDLRLGDRRIFRARSAREVENVLDLQRDFSDDGSRWLILGGQGAWKHVERLLQQDIGVLFVLDLEDAPDSEEDLGEVDGEAREYWRHPLRLREEIRREHAETVQAFLKLRQAGVDCALVPGDGSSDLMEDVSQLIEAGLPASEAYAALTTDLERLLAFESPMPHFIIHQGAFDFEQPKLRWSLCGDRAWEYPSEDEEEEAEEDADDGAPKASLAGRWKMSVDTPMGKEEFGVEFDPADGKVWVFQLGDPDDREAGGAVKFQPGRARWTFDVPDPEMEVTCFVKVDGMELQGKMKTPFGDVPMEGEPLGEPTLSSEEDAPEEESLEDGGSSPEAATASGHPQWPVETHADRLPPREAGLDGRGPLLLRGGTLYRMDGSEPSLGDLLIVDGRLEAVGGEIAAPAEARVLDATGWHLMPGIIDAHSHLAMDAINEGSMAITAECRMSDMLHAGSVGIFRAAAGGTAIAQALHGSANPIGGQSAIWELDYAADSIAELLVPGADRQIKFALGENVKQSNWSSAWGKRFPNSRLGVQAVYLRAFTAAHDYAERRRLADAGELPHFRRDLRLEVLADILDNVVHVQCHSYRADELLMFLDVCRRFGIDAPTFQHVLEGYKVAPELAADGAMASTFSDWWAYKFEVRDAIPWNVEIMHKAGVTVSINSDSDEMIRRLNTEAAKGRLYGGLSDEEAMATCTVNSARQLRLDSVMGSLEVGKQGTVSVFDGPPLSGYSRPVLTLVRGRVVFLAAEDRDRRWQEYAAEVAAFARDVEVQAEGFEQPFDAASSDSSGVASAGAASAPSRPMAPWTANGRGKSTWIRGATVHTMTEEPFVGSVLLRDGLIAEVHRGQASVDYEDRMEAEVLDARGLHLYPDFINSMDRTGLYEIGAVRASRDDIETGRDQPDLSTATAIHADSAHHHVTRMTGVAYVLSRPDFGRIRGRGALIQMEGITTPDMVVQPDLGLFVRFPRVDRFEQEDGPEVPDGIEELDDWFDRALQYGEKLDRFAAAERQAFGRDLRLEALLPYARGEQPVFLEANEATTLMAARSWAQERDLDVVYVGAREAWKVAGYLGADRAKVVIGPIHRLPGSRYSPYDSPFRNAMVLRAAGCVVSFTTNDPEVTRNLPFQAATEAAWGGDREAALRSITLDAARLLGVADRIGSIEVGKVGSVFLTAGDPLELEHPVEAMWIGGGRVELTSKQTRLRDRYLQRLEPAQR